MTETTLTYHSDPALKARIVAAAEAHRAADRFIQGSYLDAVGPEWKGCAVGCTVAPMLADEGGFPVADVRDPVDWHAARALDAAGLQDQAEALRLPRDTAWSTAGSAAGSAAGFAAESATWEWMADRLIARLTEAGAA